MSYLPNPPYMSPSSPARGLPHSSHWGAFSVLLRDGGIEVKPHPGDPAPSPLLYNIPALVAHRARIARPMVRRGWLERGPGPDRRRGRDAFVPLDWPRALDLAAAELQRIYSDYGPRGVYGGSYGWASAGRFHDAPRQLHRFLNVAGGYVRSVGSYSSGAASVILPHVIGPQEAVAGNNVSWDELVAESALVLAFGGMALKRCRWRRERRARRVGSIARGAQPRRRIPPDRPAARRSAERRRGGLAPDPPRHRCGADARHRSHLGHRSAARPRFPRSVLRWL